MFPDIPNAETILLASDYIRHRLSLEGYEWEECSVPLTPDKPRLVMRELCGLMEKMHGKDLSEFAITFNAAVQSKAKYAAVHA